MDLSKIPDVSRLWKKVPAHAGGGDLSYGGTGNTNMKFVPAHAGGVDLSNIYQREGENDTGPRPCGRGGFKRRVQGLLGLGLGPRPCGRGGFKLTSFDPAKPAVTSPPMRAGWI